MQLNGNTILITGGSSGIGAALAERFSRLGNEVIITGRRAPALAAFAEKHPGVHVKVSDAGNAASRVELAEWAAREFPQLNVLINNAGVQRYIDLQRAEPWEQTSQELEINLHASRSPKSSPQPSKPTSAAPTTSAKSSPTTPTR